jgi:hypothetical protein
MGQPDHDTQHGLAWQTGHSGVHFDYADQLPCGVPPFEQNRPGSVTPFPGPAGAGEAGPAEATYYFPIPRPGCNPTGVFFPFGFFFQPVIDVILYFHGFKLGEFQTINQYWKGGVHRIHLREDTNRSGKSVVLVAPTMGERPGSKNVGDMGIFARPAGADDFLAEVVRWIGKYVWQYASRRLTPSVRNVVLAGHSGAGVILGTQARGMTTPVREVWGFDSTYSQGKPFHRDVVADWLAAAKLRPATKFFFYWGTSGPGGNAEALRGHPSIKVEETVHDHFGVLTRNFFKRVQAASCF